VRTCEVSHSVDEVLAAPYEAIDAGPMPPPPLFPTVEADLGQEASPEAHGEPTNNRAQKTGEAFQQVRQPLLQQTSHEVPPTPPKVDQRPRQQRDGRRQPLVTRDRQPPPPLVTRDSGFSEALPGACGDVTPDGQGMDEWGPHQVSAWGPHQVSAWSPHQASAWGPHQSPTDLPADLSTVVENDHPTDSRVPAKPDSSVPAKPDAVGRRSATSCVDAVRTADEDVVKTAGTLWRPPTHELTRSCETFSGDVWQPRTPPVECLDRHSPTRVPSQSSGKTWQTIRDGKYF